MQGQSNGKLPSLGLAKYRNVDLQNDERNPFKIQQTTEKLLVVREREREFNQFNKMENEDLRVFEKNIATRQNRQGVIREINQIRPRKTGKNNELALVNASVDDAREILNKQKLNIFDA